MIVPLDRANLSGPWFINYWAFPGFFGNRPGPPVGTKASQNGRDPGITAWGQVAKGMFKYYLGAFNLDNREHAVNPLVTARAVLNLLDPEPGYYNQSAYHGDKDILAIAGGLQYQKNGAISPSMGLGNFTTYEADLLADKRLGAAGVGTLEASGYFFDARQPIRRFFVLGAGQRDTGSGWRRPALPGDSLPVHPGRPAPPVRRLSVLSRQVALREVLRGLLLVRLPDASPMAMAGAKVQSKAIQFGVQIIKF